MLRGSSHPAYKVLVGFAAVFALVIGGGQLVLLMRGEASRETALFIVTLVFGGGAVYMLPTVIARRNASLPAIAAVNYLLGWTVVGWVGALLWALFGEKLTDADVARARGVPAARVSFAKPGDKSGALVGSVLGLAMAGMGAFVVVTGVAATRWGETVKGPAARIMGVGLLVGGVSQVAYALWRARR